MKAVILAAGKGTRLQPYTDSMPKPLMPIMKDPGGSGKLISIIELLIYQIKLAGITDIIVVVNYKEDLLRAYLKDGSALGVSLEYVRQETLNGNAGAYYYAQHLIPEGEAVFITDCDNFIEDDSCIKQMVDAHSAAGVDLTVGTFPVADVTKYAIIKCDEQGIPQDIYEKPSDSTYWGTTAKSGMLILSGKLAKAPRELAETPDGEYTTTQIVKHQLITNGSLQLYGITCKCYDVGTWPDYIRILTANLTA